MNINKYFQDFLKDYVNINETRINTAKTNINWITSVLENSDVFWEILKKKPILQGSLRHWTIIKPIEEWSWFDTDILIEIDKPESWDYKDCINILYNDFYNNWTYKDKVSKKTRCVKIDYKWENSVDLVPTFQENNEYYIVNRLDNIKELSDWDWFANWFDKENKKTSWNLKKVIRLIKYIRDYNKLFDIKSIHLNLLFWKRIDDGWDYTNLQNSFISLINNLNIYLQNINKVDDLDLINPANSNENMGEWNRNLNNNELSKFKNLISKLHYIFTNKEEWEIIIELQKYFWDNFWKEYSNDYSEKQEYRWENILDKWYKIEFNSLVKASIVCNYSITEKNKLNWITRDNIRNIDYSWNTYLNKWVWLNFQVKLDNIYWNYNILWQVVNTWNEAKNAESLRWDFFPWRDKNNKQWDKHFNYEKTSYKWIHWVKAYIIQNNKLIAETGKFFVKIR